MKAKHPTSQYVMVLSRHAEDHPELNKVLRVLRYEQQFDKYLDSDALNEIGDIDTLYNSYKSKYDL